MPYLRVRIADQKQAIPAETIARRLTAIAVAELGKEASAAVVDFRYCAPQDWFVGAQPLSRLGKSGYAVEIKVTAGSNSAVQEAAFIRATHEQMQDWFPHLAETSYVIVTAVPGTAWGFGGQTQEKRHSPVG